jgi:hypothetical protein
MGLCQVDRSLRLGCGETGFDSIKEHPFFVGVDWNIVTREMISPPVVPTVRSEGDSANFDYYDEEDPELVVNMLNVQQRNAFRQIDLVLGRVKGQQA